MDMRVYEYGNPDSSTVLLQMVDDHDLAVIENEVAAIRKTAYDCLAGQGVECVLEWNRGNHFTEPDIRTAKAFAWLIGNGSGCEA